jgi:hypothetical protein
LPPPEHDCSVSPAPGSRASCPAPAGGVRRAACGVRPDHARSAAFLLGRGQASPLRDHARHADAGVRPASCGRITHVPLHSCAGEDKARPCKITHVTLPCCPAAHGQIRLKPDPTKITAVAVSTEGQACGLRLPAGSRRSAAIEFGRSAEAGRRRKGFDHARPATPAVPLRLVKSG